MNLINVYRRERSVRPVDITMFPTGFPTQTMLPQIANINKIGITSSYSLPYRKGTIIQPKTPIIVHIGKFINEI